MNKLSIAIDMGAKNNGVFIVKSDNDKILDKKATTIIINKGVINFSKKSRRENRHKDRNYKRRKLAKRLLWEILDSTKYEDLQIEQINGLLNNRGYTFISTSTEFEVLQDKTIEFINIYFKDLKGLKTKEDFENKISDFDDLIKLKDFISNINNIIEIETKKKKAEFYKEFQSDFSNIIKKDLIIIKKLFTDIIKEIDTGSKPRSKYFDDVKDEVSKLNFIENKDNFSNLIANISNFQLRVLRKYFNNKFDNKLDVSKLDTKVKGYFKAFHYKSEDEKARRKELFTYLNKEQDILNFLYDTNPDLTIPPYEDMNNRDTYKCNSMLIKPELITLDLQNAIDTILENENFSNLLISSDGEFKKEELDKIKPATNNKYIKTNFTYSKYLQRILDATQELTTKELNPRNVFKYMKMFDYGRISSMQEFKKIFGDKVYSDIKQIATLYYKEEDKILNGIYEESTSILIKCNTNTPYKNNIKHTLLKPIYSYPFTADEANNFLEAIKSTYGLKSQLELISNEAKKYQNRFYNTIISCFENKACVDDKEIKKIIKNLPNTLSLLKEVLVSLNIKDTVLNDLDTINPKNISRVLNISKQTFEILFKELGGFNKTCKNCTIENAIRSDESLTIGKRLLSDVAKPIDGMLDMLLDRLSYEIVQNITNDDIKDISTLEILLEQNRFEFEENLNDIKRANNSSIKKYKQEDKNRLNSQFCPYTGKKFDKGEYDHILPQSREVYNSKANMIYCSSQGNKDKGAKTYKLNHLHNDHLKDIFNSDNLDEIKSKITQGLQTIEIDTFKNFDSLKLTAQIALRYALFMDNNSSEYKKAFDLVKLDKIKTITNGTQKRLARIVYEKLVAKYPNSINNINIEAKTIDNMIVSSTRKSLAVDPKTGEINNLFKEDIQKSHSHCIDAMVVFYLANSKIKNQKSFKDTTIEPIFDFDDIYLEESGINNLSKNITFINSSQKEQGAYKLFDDTIYSEHYKDIDKDFKHIDILIELKLIYQNTKSKKTYLSNKKDIDETKHILVDVQKVSNKLLDLFKAKDRDTLSKLKFLDTLRYSTSRKEIVNIFFDLKATQLIKFETIKNIPYFSKNSYKAVYKKLQNEKNLFKIDDKNNSTLDSEVLNTLLKDMFASKQKEVSKQSRKRDKKRHKYTLPMLGSPKFRINRSGTWQVLGNNDIATKNYIINGDIKPIPFFSKNTIPLKVSDLLDCLLINDDTQSIYDVDINISDISKYVLNLKYLITEAKRCTVIVTLIKSSLKDIDFNKISIYDGVKDQEFQRLIEHYIDNKELEINKYIGSIRDGLKAKAILLDNNSDTITLQYKAGINKDKKQIILANLNCNNRF